MAARTSFAGFAVAALAALQAGCGGPDVEPDPGPGVARPTSGSVSAAPAERALAASLEALEGGVLEDSPLRRRVAALTDELAAAKEVRLGSVGVLDTPEVVARGLDGGHVQVSRGLLAACRDEACLAGVLALVVAELARDQATQQGPSPAQAASVGPITSLTGDPARRLQDGAALADLLRRTRDDARPDAEDEARPPEQVAVALLVQVGIDPRSLERALERLSEVERRDPAALAPFVRWRGPLAGLTRKAKAALTAELPASTTVRPPREVPLGPLDLRQVDQGAVLDAAEELSRHGPPAKALELVGPTPGARAAYVRGLAHWALAARESGDKAAAALRDAERALRTSLVLDANDVRARLALGRLYLAQDRREAARVELGEAVRRAPLLAETHYLLGLAEDDDERRRGRLELARALDAPGGPWAAAAEAALESRPSGSPPPPDPRRGRIFNAGSGRR
jgi:predicted Zn-dependent protease